MNVVSLVGAVAAAFEAGAAGTTLSNRCIVREADRIGCGASRITQSECTQRGCCYVLASGPGAPSCFFLQEAQDKPSTNFRQDSGGSIGTTRTTLPASWLPKTPTPGKTGTTGFLDAADETLSHSGKAAAKKHASSMALRKAALPPEETVVAAVATPLPAAEPLLPTVISTNTPNSAVSASAPLVSGGLAAHVTDILPPGGEYALTTSTTTAYFIPLHQDTATTTLPAVEHAVTMSTTTAHFIPQHQATTTTTLPVVAVEHAVTTSTTTADLIPKHQATATKALPVVDMEHVVTTSTTTADMIPQHQATAVTTLPVVAREHAATMRTTTADFIWFAPHDRTTAVTTLPAVSDIASLTTSQTTTHLLSVQYQATAVTTLPVVADIASLTTSKTTTHRLSVAAPVLPLSSVARITTSTTTAYSVPPATTSTTTAYVPVTASYVAVVLDTPPYGTHDKSHDAGIDAGSGMQHQMDGQGGGNPSLAGMIVLSVLTVLLGLVALVAASQCILNFLRNTSSKPVAEVSPAAEPLVHSPRDLSLSSKVLPHLPPLTTQCTPLEDSSELFDELAIFFERRWNTSEWLTCEPDCCVPCPDVREIWEIEAEPHFSTYLAKQAEIDDDACCEPSHTACTCDHGYVPGNEQIRFHGARIKCRFTGTPCGDPACNACRIIEDGNFQSSSLHSEIRFTYGSHAAKGYGLAPGKEPPPRNLKDFVSRNAGNAVFIAGVLMGTPNFVTTLTTDLPSPGSHSRVAAAATGVDEVVIFDAAQAIPKALLLFD